MLPPKNNFFPPPFFRYWFLHVIAHVCLFVIVFFAASLLLGTDLIASGVLAAIFVAVFIWL
jgi:hypothetical protein